MSDPTRDQSPLLGVVLCCTSIPPEQRSQLAALALQMGAIHKLDLTSDVTHLIVGNIDTPKYKYVAKERQDIKVLKPEWLEAVRASWIEGGDTDVTALETQYRLPTLFDLQICVTGFDDLQQRTEIQDLVSANGATYHGDLTKSVTHLIAAHPTGRKYEYAGLWHIKIVALEWLHQSIDRGMALDEALFNPLLPQEERGKGAVTLAKPPSPVLGKRSRPSDQAATDAAADGGRRKLRRSASTRLGSQSGNLWADIGPANAPQNQSPILQPEDTIDPNHKPKEQKENEPTGQGEAESFTARNTGTLKGQSDRGLFSDISPLFEVIVHGFDDRRSDVLSRLLSSEGAQVLAQQDLSSRSEESSITVVVPHAPDVAASAMLHGVKAFEDLISKGVALSSDQVVTEFWIEQCLFHHRVVRPSDVPLCEPFKFFPIAGFENLTICPTSFSGCDLLHFSKAAKLMGAKYDEYLRKETSVLVCRDASANPGKLRYALENGISVVSAMWFYDCVRSGTLLDFEDYELSTSRQSQKQSQPCFYHPVTNPRQNSASERPSKSSVSRPSAPRKAQQGRLDLAPAFPPQNSNKEQKARERESSKADDESFNTANESVGVLKDVSLSKQNSQQGRDKSGSFGSLDKSFQKSQSIARSKLFSVGVGSFHNTIHDDDSIDEVSLDVTAGPERGLAGKSDSKAPTLSSSTSAKPPDADNLNSALAAVLARRRPSSTRPEERSSIGDDQSHPLLRRHRKLGRAASNGSHVMARADSLDSHREVELLNKTSTSQAAGEKDMFDPELEATGRNRFGSRHEAAESAMFRPSQALSYEDPDALAVKEQLMKRVNQEIGAVSSGVEEAAADAKSRGERVQSIGVVKNSSSIDDKRRRGMRRK